MVACVQWGKFSRFRVMHTSVIVTVILLCRERINELYLACGTSSDDPGKDLGSQVLVFSDTHPQLKQHFSLQSSPFLSKIIKVKLFCLQK